jgi:hypothetical protein
MVGGVPAGVLRWDMTTTRPFNLFTRHRGSISISPSLLNQLARQRLSAANLSIVPRKV